MIVEHEVKVRHEHNDLNTIEVLCKGEYAKFVRERTCKNISNPPEGFLCSACRWGDFAEPSHLLTGAKYTGRDNEGPNYCPNCGKRLV